MCVILVCDTKRPNDDMVEKAWTQNPQGGGIAYRKDNLICWEKGLDLKEMKQFAKDLPFPFVLHFRIASTGTRSAYLCHPFHISAEADVDLIGSTDKAVLFHNGTWGNWRYNTLSSIVNVGAKIPTGPWSDTRAMALMAHHFGGGALEMINERTVFFSPTELEIYGDGWEEEGDILMSNTIFLKKFQSTTTVTYPYGTGGQGSTTWVGGTHNGRSGVAEGNGNTSALVGAETVHVISGYERARGGPSLDVTFRGSLTVIDGGKAQSREVEEDTEQVLEGASEGGAAGAEKKLTPAEEAVLAAWAHSINNKLANAGLTGDEEVKKRIDAKGKGIEYLGRI